MERINDTTESGYEGGSQENILDEPHYEYIKNPGPAGEYHETKNGTRYGESEERHRKTEENAKHAPENKYNEKKTVPNGCAKFCNGTDSEFAKREQMAPDYDCQKVTIHAVIEAMHESHIPEPQMRDNHNPQMHDNHTPQMQDNHTSQMHENHMPQMHDNHMSQMHENHMPQMRDNHMSQMRDNHTQEPQMDRDSIDSADSFDQADSSYPKGEATYDKSPATYVESEEHYSKEELYAKLEEVYSKPENKRDDDSHSVKEAIPMQKLVKNEGNTAKDDVQKQNTEEIYSDIKAAPKERDENIEAAANKEQKIMVQKLVKVAEDEGIAPKPPTPTPRNSSMALGNSKDERTFLEEEYSYEPELKRSSSKLVLRTRSLLNLEEDKPRAERNMVRPPAVRVKITTGPDGTFVIDGRKANSELDLSDESSNGTQTKPRRSISGEELKKRKEEIFKQKPSPAQNTDKYNQEINQNGNKTTKEEAIHNLKKYLKENNIGLKELLTNNNVVIIDTYRDKKDSEDLSEYNHKTVRECRITGTTAKGEARESNTLPRASKVHQPVVQRHYFYRLLKSRPNLPDEELPDPDKVRSTRQMFQKPKECAQTGIMLPMTAKLGNPRKEVRATPEVRVVQGKRSPRGWTDSGSLSSGVSSDMSVLDNMSDKSYSSDEEDIPSPPEVDQHPVSPEVMDKIRACGTTITYYGGRVISHSHGSGNQMTMTIMDEIRQGREAGRGKFRLVKSNSCGSRLELAGTDEQQFYHELSHSRFYEDMYGGRNLCEEMKGSLGPVEEERKEEQARSEGVRAQKNEEVRGEVKKEVKKIDEEEVNKDKKEVKKIDEEEVNKDKKPSWRELIESRKQRRAMEHSRRPCSDMVFEEFQVLEA